MADVYKLLDVGPWPENAPNHGTKSLFPSKAVLTRVSVSIPGATQWTAISIQRTGYCMRCVRTDGVVGRSI